MDKYKKINQITILSIIIILTSNARTYASGILDFQLDESITEEIDMSLFEDLEEGQDKLKIKKAYYNNMKSLNPIAFENDINRKFYSRDGSIVLGYNKKTKKYENIDIGQALKDVKGESYLPLEEKYLLISSRYGFRKDPFNLKIADQGGIDLEDLNSVNTGFHSGLDLAASEINGANVYNFLDGKVKKIEKSNTGYGNLIVIDSGSFESYYAHLSEINNDLKEGQVVKTGDLLGRVGSTGRSTGPHLHIETIVGDIAINPQILLHDALINSRFIREKKEVEVKKELNIEKNKNLEKKKFVKPVLFKIEDFLIEAKS